MSNTCGRINLADFQASEEIGLLLDDPLEYLPPYFQIWNELGKQMPSLVSKGVLRDRVHEMPLLDHRQLKTYKELRLAHVQLANITAGYVWQNGDQGATKVLPSCIAVPLWEISQRIGLPAAISQSDMVEANWAKIDPKGQMVAENLRCLYPIPGGKEDEWFVQVSVEMAAIIGPALKGILDAMQCAEMKDEEGLIAALDLISDSMSRIKESLSRIHDVTTPDTFYNVSRPFMFGWGGKDSALPDGLIYEGVSNIPKKTTIGGSSAMCQVVDAVLGTTYREACKEFATTDRELTTPEHRALLIYVRENSHVRKAVQESTNSALRSAFNGCVMSMADFRSYHIQVVGKYVTVASKKTSGDKNIYAAAKTGGTGGTSGMPLLKSLRDSSLDTLINCDNSSMCTVNTLIG